MVSCGPGPGPGHQPKLTWRFGDSDFMRWYCTAQVRQLKSPFNRSQTHILSIALLLTNSMFLHLRQADFRNVTSIAISACAQFSGLRYNFEMNKWCCVKI